jgi:tetratricopeptide (TPR) repeat protein
LTGPGRAEHHSPRMSDTSEEQDRSAGQAATSGEAGRRALPWERGLFSVALLVLASLVGLGLVRSLTTEGGLPSPSLRYVPHLNSALNAGDAEHALREMRIAVLIDSGSETVEKQVLPKMARLAHDLGDRDTELLALRQLVRLHREDASLHLRLSTALLSVPELGLDELKEAGQHAELALRSGGGGAEAWYNLSRVAHAVGQPQQAAEALRRAATLDPGVVERMGPGPKWTGEQ